MPAAPVSLPQSPQASDPSLVGTNQVAGFSTASDLDLSADTKLNLALQAIDEASQQTTEVVAQPIISQLAQGQIQPAPIRGGKERAGAVSPETSVIDAGGFGAVEYEPTPEVSPEIEEYVQRVEEHAETLSEPIVVDGQTISNANHHHPTQPVVVLPITEEDEKKAHFKSPKYSIKWLVEWSHKIIKKFVGQVIYRVE